MKEFLLAAPLLGISVVSALAADIAAVPRTPSVVMSSWAGFYLGAHGGYGWGDNDFLSVLSSDPLRMGGIKSKGAIYGGHAGYNWQFGRVVAGVELDFSGADIRGSTAASITRPAIPPITFAFSRADDIKYLGTARARLGWLPADNVLLYGTAGLGWERVDRTETQIQTSFIGALPASFSTTSRTPLDRFGWVAGAGAEVALWNSNWVGRIEYLHYDFGTTESTTSFVTTPASASRIDRGGRQTIDAVRTGLSYKFGVFGPASGVTYAKAPVAAPQSSWAGFYLGVHGGYGWADNRFSTTLSVAPPAVINGIKSAGWVAGGQVGHNWQFDRVVAGLELDLSGTGIEGSSTTPLLDTGGGRTETFKLSDRVKYLGTARGRLGWLPTDNILLYGTAGLAWERLERTETDVNTAGGVTETAIYTSPVDHFGWVAGVGAESLLFGTNWVGRIEYLHYDFGTASSSSSTVINFPPTPVISFANSAGRQTIDVVRAGISYKLGDPALAPAVAYAKAPRLAALSNWDGLYLGVHGGYGWSDNDFSFDQGNGRRIGGITSKGWVGGGQAGYNWQFGRAVAGLEADFSVTGIKGDSAPLVTGGGLVTNTLSDDVKYLGTARGRLGWLPLDNVLLYGTAGLAWERVNRTETWVDLSPPPATFISTRPDDHFGWVAGAGAETLLWNSNWIGRVEYLHYDFGTIEGTTNFSSTNPATTARVDHGGRQTIDVVRAGVSYKFNGGGPVVAKY
jgi:outer membrane immunogenic protein